MRFLQVWIALVNSNFLCTLLLHLHQKTTCNQKSNMGEIFLNLLIWKLKIHNAVTTFVQSHLKFYPFRQYKKMGSSSENVVYLKSVQVMVRLHVFPIFSFLAKISAERWQHFCQKWKCRKNMQADNKLNRLYLKYFFTYMDNSGSIICFLLISNFWNNDILFQRRLNLRGYFKKNEQNQCPWTFLFTQLQVGGQ